MLCQAYKSRRSVQKYHQTIGHIPSNFMVSTLVPRDCHFITDC